MLGTHYTTPSAESILLLQHLMTLNPITCQLTKAFLRLALWLAIYLYQEMVVH